MKRLALMTAFVATLAVPPSSFADGTGIPLYVRLEDGTKCYWMGGATSTALNARVSFACGHDGDSPRYKFLLGSPDQHGAIAFIVSENLDDEPIAYGVETHVTVAPCTFEYIGAATVYPTC
jgi:hypothetical protein